MYNILFIFISASSRFIFVDYHHGIGLLSALLKREGHNTSLLRISSFDRKRLDREVEAYRPDIIAYSFASDQAPLAITIMDYLAKRRIFSVAGGVHATLLPNDIIPHVDALCIGEGEGPLVDLIKDKSSATIPNLWIRQEGRLIKNAPRPYLSDLDVLPFSDRELFDYQNALDQDHRADFMAGRGCPFHCAYCINNHVQDLAAGTYTRYRSVPNVIAEIKRVLEDYRNIESICFQDDIFASRKSWLTDFCSQYRREIGLPFVCNLRVGLVDKEIVTILAEAGCIEARIGVEQGNEQLRREIMDRKMTNKQIIETFALIKAAGIKIFSYNMVGIPGETEATIQETIALNRIIKPDKVHVSIFHPYPGTDLYDLCRTNGYFTSENSESYFEPVAILNLPTISKSNVEYYFRIFRTAVVYEKFLPIVKLLAKAKLSKQTTLYDIAFRGAFMLHGFLRKHLPATIKEPLFKMLKA